MRAASSAAPRITSSGSAGVAARAAGSSVGGSATSPCDPAGVASPVELAGSSTLGFAGTPRISPRILPAISPPISLRISSRARFVRSSRSMRWTSWVSGARPGDNQSPRMRNGIGTPLSSSALPSPCPLVSSRGTIPTSSVRAPRSIWPLPSSVRRGLASRKSFSSAMPPSRLSPATRLVKSVSACGDNASWSEPSASARTMSSRERTSWPILIPFSIPSAILADISPERSETSAFRLAPEALTSIFRSPVPVSESRPARTFSASDSAIGLPEISSSMRASAPDASSPSCPLHAPPKARAERMSAVRRPAFSCAARSASSRRTSPRISVPALSCISASNALRPSRSSGSSLQPSLASPSPRNGVRSTLSVARSAVSLARSPRRSAPTLPDTAISSSSPERSASSTVSSVPLAAPSRLKLSRVSPGASSTSNASRSWRNLSLRALSIPSIAPFPAIDRAPSKPASSRSPLWRRRAPVTDSASTGPESCPLNSRRDSASPPGASMANAVSSAARSPVSNVSAPSTPGDCETVTFP